MKRIAIAAVLLVSLVGPAPAGQERAPTAEELREMANELLHPHRWAAEQGDAEAQVRLGSAYESGRDLRQDYAKALKWYRLAAEQGYASAQHNLGRMYVEGKGVPQDYAEAVKWYRDAAEQNFGPAQYNLGIMYAEGKGVQQDYVHAHMWFNLAGVNEFLKPARIARDAAAEKMTPADITKAQAMAREWMEVHKQ